MFVAPYRMARSSVRNVQNIHNMPHTKYKWLGRGDWLGTN